MGPHGCYPCSGADWIAIAVADHTEWQQLCDALGARMLANDPRSAWLIVMPVIVVYLAYRGYSRQRQKHESLEFLYDSTRRLQRSASIDDAQGQLRRTASDLRELAAGLHPRELVEYGLGSALAALAERSPIPVDVEAPAERLPESVELTLFFVCSEALANAWKHSRASRTSIVVERTPASARLEVRDDGVGGAEPRSLADRIEAVGGTLVVDSPLGGGTRLLAEFPLP